MVPKFGEFDSNKLNLWHFLTIFGYNLNLNSHFFNADVHTRPVFNNRKDDLYWQRTTYRNADAMFPNYALNYPAPIHHLQYQGNISPSIQYPETVMPKYR